MTYADTDFFLALMKESDWLQENAMAILEEHRRAIWTSPATLIELLLVAHEFELDAERLLIDVLEIAELRGGDPGTFIMAARYMKSHGARTFDALHAAVCGKNEAIISSDRIFDKIGLKRIDLKGKGVGTS